MYFPKIEEYNKHNNIFIAHKPAIIIRLLVPLLNLTNRNGTQIIFKIRDFLTVICWSLSDNNRYDYLIGLESVNAIAGIILRKLGKYKRVIYYVSDYSPNRYPQKWFNRLYLSLDRYSAMHADYIWDVSPAIQKARIQAGMDPAKTAPVIHVPNGLYPSQIKSASAAEISPHAMVYMGTLGPENGPDVAIEALALVRKKFPDATLHIIGGSEKDFAWLKPYINQNHLEKSVIYHGFIPKGEDMSKIIRQCAIGLAPYRAISGSPRYYGDAGKIRVYCAAGLPVICSRVPPLGHEVARKGAALIVNDDTSSLARAIVGLFSDPNLYLKLRNNAISIAHDNTWNSQFKNAFVRMIAYGDKNLRE